jgi:hypothetical protein
MKNKKWVTYLLGALLTLIALTVVGVAGFRAGMMQSADYPRMGIGERPAFNQNVDKNNPRMQASNPDEKDDLGRIPQSNGFHPRGFDRGMPMRGGPLGLIHIAILALLLWFGYKFVQKSSWRLVRVQNEAPRTSETVNAEVNEKKESE